MSTNPTCQRCGRPLQPSQLDGCCPACLLALGGPDETGTGGDATLPPKGAQETVGMGPSSEPVPSGDRQLRSTARRLGDYEIEQEIARGGMGVVYRARQTGLDRTVALKTILAGALAGTDEIQRFRTEAEAAARLEHPSIVPIYDVGEVDGQHFYAMAYVEGRSLADRLSEGPMDPREAAELAQSIATAVGYAHEQGVIHRDLKPANVLLDHAGQPKITDFGLAKRVENDRQLTATGQILGTPSYMPPEQAGSKDDLIGPPSDVYSVGAILYEQLTGRPPFQADTPLNTVLEVLENEPVAPHLFRNGIPRDLETICLKCLEKEPERRYANGGELADDLQRFLEDRPIHARPASIVTRGRKWLRRQRRSVTLTIATLTLALLTVLVSALLFVGYQQWQQGELAFTTSGEPFTAELRSIDSQELVVPPFTVPTSTDLTVPSGTYELLVKRPGILSQRSLLEVRRSMLQIIDATAEWSQLFPDVEMEGWVQVAHLDDSVSLIEVGPESIKRRSASDGGLIWSVDMRRDAGAVNRPVLQDVMDANADFGWSWYENDWTVSGQGEYNTRPVLVKPLRDLDNDGTKDLVWALRHHAVVMAQSGADGEMLWFWDAKIPSSRQYSSPHMTRVIDSHLTTDIDGDQLGDLLVISAITGMSQAIVAISSATGDAIWEQSIPREWLDIPENSIPQDRRIFIGSGFGSGTDQISDGPSPYHHSYLRRSSTVEFRSELIRVTHQEGMQRWLLNAGSRLVEVDVGQGGWVDAPIDLGFVPAIKPRAIDVDSDHNDELMMIDQVSRVRNRLVVTRWPAVDPLYAHEFVAHRIRNSWEDEYPWPIVADLDEDGRPEIIIPDARIEDGTNQVGLQVIRAEDGESVWRQSFWITLRWLTASQINQFKDGPDIDGDGYRDLFVASVANCPGVSGGQLREGTLIVEARSGRDGQLLWLWSRQYPEHGGSNINDNHVRQLMWWNDEHGQPMRLIVRYEPDPTYQNHPTETLVFDVWRGELVHESDSCWIESVGDLDGDSADDVVLVAAPDAHRNRRAGAKVDRGGVLRCLRGTKHEQWRRLAAKLNPMDDVTGDGIDDVFLVNEMGLLDQVTVVSGSTGLPVISSPDLAGGAQPLSWPHGAPDLNGDGVRDIVMAPATNTTVSRPMDLPLAISGVDGKRLWPGPMRTNSSRGVVTIGHADLNRDNVNDIVLLVRVTPPELVTSRMGHMTSDIDSKLVAISGRDGSLIWQRKFNLPPNAQIQIAEHDQVDANGDGIDDFFIGGLTGEQPAVSAVDGRTGEWLWRAQRFERYQDSPIAIAVLPPHGENSARIATMEARMSSELEDSQQRSNARAMQLLTVYDANSGMEVWRWTAPFHSVMPDRSNLPDGFWQVSVFHYDSNSPPGLLTRTTAIDSARQRPGGKDETQAFVLIDYRGKQVTKQNIELALSQEGWDFLRRAGKTRSDTRLGGSFLNSTWRVLDLDRDGQDEVVYFAEDGLRALDADLEQTIWQYSIPDQPGLLLTAETGGSQAPTLEVQLDDAVVSLDGATGRVRWRCPAPPDAQVMNVKPASLLRQGRNGQEPLVMYSTRSGVTICFDPGERQGNLAFEQSRLVKDPRRIARLPWADLSKVWQSSIIENRRAPFEGAGVIILLVLVVASYGGIRYLIRSRPLTVRRLMVFVAFCSVVIASFQVLWRGLPAEVTFVDILWAGMVVLMWVGPALLSLVLLTKALIMGRWRKLIGLIVGWCLFTIAATVLLVGLFRWSLDAPQLVYSTEGWYWILVVGIHFLGIGIVAANILRRVWGVLLRGWRRLRPRAAAATI